LRLEDEVVQIAYAFSTDSVASPRVLQTKPEVIAGASIVFGAEICYLRSRISSSENDDNVRNSKDYLSSVCQRLQLSAEEVSETLLWVTDLQVRIASIDTALSIRNN